MYYRDIRKVEGHKGNTNYDFELKEARADGYEWRRRSNHFMKQEWCNINKSTYHYFDTETGRIDSTWAKNFYIFPKEDKMIIAYKGDNSLAEKRPHGNARTEPAPDHYSRLPEVRAELIDIAGNPPGVTQAEAFRRMTGEDRAGAGQHGVINVPKNTRAVKNIFDQVSQALNNQHDISLNIQLANNIVGGSFLRRAEVLRAENQYIVFAHDDAIREFKDICNNYKGTDPLMFHMDTSFNAGGKKSGYLITHLLLAHPYITRARSGGDQSGVNLPLACMVHQRRTMPTIKQLLVTADDVFEFGKVKHRTILVSDQEYGESSRLWKNATKVYCWNHIRKDVEWQATQRFWVGKDVANKVSNQVYRLLCCHDEQEYLQTKNEFFTNPKQGEDLWKDP